MAFGADVDDILYDDGLENDPLAVQLGMMDPLRRLK